MTRSIRNFLATHNLLAVSARQQEVAMNTEQALDTTLLVDLNTVLNYQALKNPNREELTGKEEADRLHDFGGKVVGALAFSRAQPQHFAFLLGYGLGEVETNPAGATGYRHTIRPRSGEVDVARSNPSFTAAMRFGRQVLKRRFASCFIDQIRMDFARDGWAKLNGTVKGSGKVVDNTQVEAVAAADNATSLTLAVNGVAGETAGGEIEPGPGRPGAESRHPGLGGSGIPGRVRGGPRGHRHYVAGGKRDAHHLPGLLCARRERLDEPAGPGGGAPPEGEPVGSDPGGPLGWRHL